MGGEAYVSSPIPLMTKGELIEAMADFSDDMPTSVDSVEEICPTGIDTSENYLEIT